MGTRVSRSMVELTPEREAIIRARRKIRPDEPGTNPGDPGNGHVLVIDERTQKFNGFKYNLYSDAKYFIRFEGKKQYFLHKDVWQFHNGNVPSGKSLKYYIHHDHKDEHGNWDTHCNDIEHLLLMQPDEHKAWHAKYHPLIEIECAVCHKTFSAKSKTAKYCPDCVKKVSAEKRDQSRNRHKEPFKTFEESSQDIVAVEDDIPRVSGNGEKVIRYCFFCHRAYEALVSKTTVSCGRPDCADRAVANAYEQAKAFAFKQKMEHCGGVYRFFSKKIKSTIRCIFIDGEIWMVATDVAKALGYKDAAKAIRTHVKPKHKRTINRTEVDLDRGAKRPSSSGAVSGINREIVVIDEAGFYKLSFASKLPEAEEFTEWVTCTVLPALRKYGSFIITDETMPPMPLPEDTTFVLLDANDQPFSFSTEERDFMQKLIPAYRQMNEDDRALLAELIERNQN